MSHQCAACTSLFRQSLTYVDGNREPSCVWAEGVRQMERKKRAFSGVMMALHGVRVFIGVWLLLFRGTHVSTLSDLSTSLEIITLSYYTHYT
jgi:hypothetical protein